MNCLWLPLPHHPSLWSPTYLQDGNGVLSGKLARGPQDLLLDHSLSNFFTELVPVKEELVLTRPSVIKAEIFSTLMANVKYVESWVCYSWTFSAHTSSLSTLELSCTSESLVHHSVFQELWILAQIHSTRHLPWAIFHNHHILGIAPAECKDVRLHYKACRPPDYFQERKLSTLMSLASLKYI